MKIRWRHADVRASRAIAWGELLKLHSLCSEQFTQLVNRLAICRLNHRYREIDTLGVPLKNLNPFKGGNNRPGTAFWLVLIIIGGVTVWQKVNGSAGPASEVRTGMTISDSSLNYGDTVRITVTLYQIH
jgi:hypothetical protein